MFVQLSVAGIVLLFAISGIFFPDDAYQRSPDEICYDDQEEVPTHFPENTLYWQKALGSLDLTLGLSAGLGTILAAILSYRFGQNRWRVWGQKFRNFLWKEKNLSKKEVQIILSPQERSAYSTDSKEAIYPFQSPGFDQSSSTFVEEEHNETFDVASSSCCNDKSETFELKSEEDTDSNVFMMTESLTDSKSDIGSDTRSETEAPQYKTLEARILAVEGNLMRDIHYRMKVFEKQLEEFRAKMRRPEDRQTEMPASTPPVLGNDDCGSITPPSPSGENFQQKAPVAEVEVAHNKLKMPMTRNVYNSSKVSLLDAHCDKLCDLASETGSRESLANIISAGDAGAYTCQANEGSSDSPTEKEGTKMATTPKSRAAGRRPGSLRRNTEKRPDSKSEPVRQETPVKQSQSSSAAAARRRELSSDKIEGRGRQPRTKQQIQSILQQTNAKLAQRNRQRQFKA